MAIGVSKQKLLAYAHRIQSHFSQVWNLSQTGLRTSSDRVQIVNASSAESDEASDTAGRTGGAVPRADAQRARTDDTRRLLANWQYNPDGHFQVIAPFGFGKSSQLSMFAVDLAGALIQVLETLDVETGLLRIPLPVQLRRLNRANSPRTSRQWLDFLLETQTAFADPDSAFTADELLDLLQPTQRSGRQLVCLYDGLDEVAADKQVINAMLQFHEGKAPFLISSREPVREIAHERTLVLQPLAKSAVLNMIRTRPENSTRPLAGLEREYEALPPTVQEMLCRPLFLASWISRYAELPLNGSIKRLKTVEDLMIHVTLEGFDRAREVHPDKCPAEKHVQRETLPVLGWVLLADAISYFDGESRDLPQRFNLLQQLNGLTGYSRQQHDEAVILAQSLGFLITNGDGSFAAVKTPVVEFLVGRCLAHAACGGPDQKAAFISIIRRWIYRPTTYDLLDFCWSILADHRGDGVSELLLNLLAWMYSATQCEPVFAIADSSRPAVPDCLVRPAAGYAIRLMDRTHITQFPCEGSPVTIQQVTQLLIERGHQRSMQPPGAATATSIAVMQGLLAESNRRRLQMMQSSVRHFLDAVANVNAILVAVPGAQAALKNCSDTAAILTTSTAYEGDDPGDLIYPTCLKLMSLQKSAELTNAHRSSIQAALKTLDEASFRIMSHAERVRKINYAIAAAAENCTPRSAVEIVELLISHECEAAKLLPQQSGLTSNKSLAPTGENPLAIAVQVAAGKLDAAHAPALIKDLLKRFDGADELLKSWLHFALMGTAAAVAETQAVGLIDDLIGQSTATSTTLEGTIAALALRMPRRDAAAKASSYFKLYLTPADHRYLLYFRAAMASAARLPPDDWMPAWDEFAAYYEKCLELSEICTQDVDPRFPLAMAQQYLVLARACLLILCAISEMPDRGRSNRPYSSNLDLLGSVPASLTGEMARLIAASAARVPEEQALDHVELLRKAMRQLGDEKNFNEARTQLERAMRNAAKRIPTDRVPSMIRNWIAETAVNIHSDLFDFYSNAIVDNVHRLTADAAWALVDEILAVHFQPHDAEVSETKLCLLLIVTELARQLPDERVIAIFNRLPELMEKSPRSLDESLFPQIVKLFYRMKLPETVLDGLTVLVASDRTRPWAAPIAIDVDSTGMVAKQDSTPLPGTARLLRLSKPRVADPSETASETAATTTVVGILRENDPDDLLVLDRVFTACPEALRRLLQPGAAEPPMVVDSPVSTPPVVAPVVADSPVSTPPGVADNPVSPPPAERLYKMKEAAKYMSAGPKDQNNLKAAFIKQGIKFALQNRQGSFVTMDQIKELEAIYLAKEKPVAKPVKPPGSHWFCPNRQCKNFKVRKPIPTTINYCGKCKRKRVSIPE